MGRGVWERLATFPAPLRISIIGHVGNKWWGGRGAKPLSVLQLPESLFGKEGLREFGVERIVCQSGGLDSKEAR